jgi:hypothetical protein
MSYHILHQFDEQWLAELRQDTGGGRGSFLAGSDDESPCPTRPRLSARERKRWAVVAASVLLAAFALLFSIDASRRAEILQQRLDTLETAVRK